MRLLIWDFDGTLGYRESGMFGAAMLELLRREMPGLEIEPERLRPYLRTGFPWHTPDRPHPEIKTSAAWWDALAPVFENAFRGIGATAQQARSLSRNVRHVYADPARWRLFHKTLETLDGLRARGWTHVLLSNHVPELRRIVDHLGLTSRLARVFNSAQTGYEKPHPRAFRIVLEALPDATAVWMIGDSIEADVLGAEAIGIPAILVHKQDPRATRACSTLSAVEVMLTGEEPSRAPC